MSRIAHVPSLVQIAFALSPGLLFVAPFQTARAAAVTLPAAQGSDETGGPTEARSDESVPMVFPVDAATLAELRADAARSASGEPTERLIYSNTLGINAIRFGNGQLVADDITTTAPVGCNLTRFRFNVLGRVVPTDPGGPYTVRYALYNNCPQAVPSAQRVHYTDEALPNTGIKIRGTDGAITFPDDAPRIVEHIVADPSVVPIPTNLWLGISFTRANCGTIVGAPAMVGHSADNMDFGGSVACNGFLGGFPEQPQASLWAEMFGGAHCPDSFVGYKAARASGAQFSAGAHVPFLDDVKLIVNDCQMIGYEVAVRGQGFYEFDLVRDCGGLSGPCPPDTQWVSSIPGTFKTFSVNLSTQPLLQLARFSFDPPIPLNTDALYFRFLVANTTGGVVQAGIPPTIGSSSEDYFLVNSSCGCDPVIPAPGSTVSGVFHASITCAGTMPLGACCDPYLTQCAGGADDGKRCRTNADCATPGTCEAVCRQVAEINCPFPPRGQDLDPKWKEAAGCSPEPYPNTPCGIAACCHMTENPYTHQLDYVCDNMTMTECETAPPLDKPRQWQLGSYCGLGAQDCPRDPGCGSNPESCFIAHNSPGCCDASCCFEVCDSFLPGDQGEPIDYSYCCQRAWDWGCVDLAGWLCGGGPPPLNDTCAPKPSPNPNDCMSLPATNGALQIQVPGSAQIDNRWATNDPTDPGFCCHGGVSQCVGGTNAGKPCVAASDCPGGACPEPIPMPSARGYGSIWFKFVQPASSTSAQIYTCSSNSPARDSLLQVFKVGDSSSPENACRTLSVIGCNDDFAGCSSSSRNSKLCLQNLVPGETYYIMVAAKTPQTMGPYRVTVSAGCTGGDLYPNDYCPNANPITDGSTLFNLTGATFDCPGEFCVPNALNDLWYNYTATCTGQAKFETCGESSETSPNTNLVVYEGCDKCPPIAGQILGCNNDAYQNCGLGSRVAVDVQQGQCYKVRLADENGFLVAGFLTISCEPVGACCDWVKTDANGEAVCRDVPLSQCPALPNGDSPQWIEGVSCASNPFDPPCGKAACCHLREGSFGKLEQVCENLTKSECDLAPPLDHIRMWQPGELCGMPRQGCPWLVCLESTKSCYETHTTPGCCDEFCCDFICRNHGPVGAFCCELEWDSSCVDLMMTSCDYGGSGNDSCAPNPDDRCPNGAKLIAVPGSVPIDNRHATTSAGEPGFCCHGGVGICVGGLNQGKPCVVPADCPGTGAYCTDLAPSPGLQGYGTIWFKFVQPLTGANSVLINTCASNSPALDSLLQVFAARDHSSEEAACQSLVTIGCNDDTPGCSSTGRNSRVCVQNLVPGQTYYIMVAAKTPQTMGQYRVAVSAGCTGAGLPEVCPAFCPSGPTHFIDPPNGAVDARRPHAPDDPLATEGISILHATGPTGIRGECWSLCEPSTSSSPNLIQSVVESPTRNYTITLVRPITPGAVTALTYLNWLGIATTGRFTSHPANVNGDSMANALDILDLIDALNGVRALPWGNYSGDLDRSGLIAPADILEEIDLLNGAGAYAVWYGTPRPEATGVCP